MLEPKTIDEFRQQIANGIRTLQNILPDAEWEIGRLFHEFSRLYNSYELVNRFYAPDKTLIDRIDDLFADSSRTKTEKGQLMEEIAVLAFKCLAGWDRIESYQSYAAQHDLVLSGSSDQWYELMEYLHLRKGGRTIVIEAKNLKGKIEDKHFSRLCSILQNKFENTSHLGVFVSRHGATGFEYRRVLRDARATQILFHARTQKFVVVLTSGDFAKLKEIGGLPRLLEEKIRDVEGASDIPLDDSYEWKQINLPPYLACYFPDESNNR